MRAAAVLLAAGLVATSLGSCTPIVRYTNDLTDVGGGAARRYLIGSQEYCCPAMVPE